MLNLNFEGEIMYTQEPWIIEYIGARNKIIEQLNTLVNKDSAGTTGISQMLAAFYTHFSNNDSTSISNKNLVDEAIGKTKQQYDKSNHKAIDKLGAAISQLLDMVMPPLCDFMKIKTNKTGGLDKDVVVLFLNEAKNALNNIALTNDALAIPANSTPKPNSAASTNFTTNTLNSNFSGTTYASTSSNTPSSSNAMYFQLLGRRKGVGNVLVTEETNPNIGTHGGMNSGRPSRTLARTPTINTHRTPTQPQARTSTSTSTTNTQTTTQPQNPDKQIPSTPKQADSQGCNYASSYTYAGHVFNRMSLVTKYWKGFSEEMQQTSINSMSLSAFNEIFSEQLKKWLNNNDDKTIAAQNACLSINKFGEKAVIFTEKFLEQLKKRMRAWEKTAWENNNNRPNSIYLPYMFLDIGKIVEELVKDTCNSMKQKIDKKEIDGNLVKDKGAIDEIGKIFLQSYNTLLIWSFEAWKLENKNGAHVGFEIPKNIPEEMNTLLAAHNDDPSQLSIMIDNTSITAGQRRANNDIQSLTNSELMELHSKCSNDPKPERQMKANLFFNELIRRGALSYAPPSNKEKEKIKFDSSRYKNYISDICHEMISVLLKCGNKMPSMIGESLSQEMRKIAKCDLYTISSLPGEQVCDLYFMSSVPDKQFVQGLPRPAYVFTASEMFYCHDRKWTKIGILPEKLAELKKGLNMAETDINTYLYMPKELLDHHLQKITLISRHVLPIERFARNLDRPAYIMTANNMFYCDNGNKTKIQITNDDFAKLKNNLGITGADMSETPKASPLSDQQLQDIASIIGSEYYAAPPQDSELIPWILRIIEVISGKIRQIIEQCAKNEVSNCDIKTDAQYKEALEIARRDLLEMPTNIINTMISLLKSLPTPGEFFQDTKVLRTAESFGKEFASTLKLLYDKKGVKFNSNGYPVIKDDKDKARTNSHKETSESSGAIYSADAAALALPTVAAPVVIPTVTKAVTPVPLTTVTTVPVLLQRAVNKSPVIANNKSSRGISRITATALTTPAVTSPVVTPTVTKAATPAAFTTVTTATTSPRAAGKKNSVVIINTIIAQMESLRDTKCMPQAGGKVIVKLIGEDSFTSNSLDAKNEPLMDDVYAMFCLAINLLCDSLKANGIHGLQNQINSAIATTINSAAYNHNFEEERCKKALSSEKSTFIRYLGDLRAWWESHRNNLEAPAALKELPNPNLKQISLRHAKHAVLSRIDRMISQYKNCVARKILISPKSPGSNVQTVTDQMCLQLDALRKSIEKNGIQSLPDQIAVTMKGAGAQMLEWYKNNYTNDCQTLTRISAAIVKYCAFLDEWRTGNCGGNNQLSDQALWEISGKSYYDENLASNPAPNKANASTNNAGLTSAIGGAATVNYNNTSSQQQSQQTRATGASALVNNAWFNNTPTQQQPSRQTQQPQNNTTLH